MKQIRRPAVDAQAARHVAHVERSGAGRRRGGRRRGRAPGGPEALLVGQQINATSVDGSGAVEPTS